MPPRAVKKPALHGEGSYGCVFEPPISCSSAVAPVPGTAPVAKKRGRAAATREVGKVFTEPDRFREELRLAGVAAEAVGASAVAGPLLLPTGYCRTSLRRAREHPSHGECEALADLGAAPANTGLYQLLMPYGGLRFDRYIRKQARAAPEGVFPAEKLAAMLLPLAEGLADISRHGYSHQDIKTGNMLVTPRGKLLLIDYGLMVSKKEMYAPANASRLRYTYFPYPPEFKIASYIVRGRCCNPVVEVYKNLEHLGTERRNIYLSMHPDKKTRDAVEGLYRDLMAAGGKEGGAGAPGATRRFLAPYADRVDVYSLGMALVDLWRYLAPDARFQEIVAGMTEPDPRERLSPEELVMRLKGYFGAKG